MTLIEEKQAFGARLKDALRKACMPWNSPTQVTREFNLRYHGNPVTVQSARKWLEGRALPSQDKIVALASWLDVSPQWLRFGEGDRKEARAHGTAKQDPAAYNADSKWAAHRFEMLNDAHRKMVLEVMRALLRLEGKQ